MHCLSWACSQGQPERCALVSSTPPPSAYLPSPPRPLAEELQAEGGGEAAPAASPLAAGTWRLVWTQQGETANPLQKALAGQVENFQIISEDGRLENLVKPLPGVRVRACAACAPEAGPLGDATRTAVEIDQVVIELGGLAVPLSLKRDARGFVEW